MIHFLRTSQIAVFQEIRNLHPGYFALVMATGIVGMACQLLEFILISNLLLHLNFLFITTLSLLFLYRILFFFSQFKRDWSDSLRGPGYMSIVAGVAVFGNQILFAIGNNTFSKILYFITLLLWLLCIYVFLIAISTASTKPSLKNGINGLWLLLTVATQSVSILGMTTFANDISLFISTALFLVGCFLYIILITLIFYRLTFFKIQAEDMSPTYWINMGAVAITTLAGASLLQITAPIAFLIGLRPFILGLTVLFWAFGTWWIPFILFMGFWRHLVKKISIRYHPQYWGLVFPLGMYTVCTYRLAQLDSLSFLSSLPSIFIYPAISAWILTFYGMASKIFLIFFRK